MLQKSETSDKKRKRFYDFVDAEESGIIVLERFQVLAADASRGRAATGGRAGYTCLYLVLVDLSRYL